MAWSLHGLHGMPQGFWHWGGLGSHKGFMGSYQSFMGSQKFFMGSHKAFHMGSHKAFHLFTAAATLAWQQHVFWTQLIVWSSLASCCWHCTLACLWHQGLAHMAANVNCWEQMCLVHNMGSQKALAKDMVVKTISITHIAINFVYITI